MIGAVRSWARAAGRASEEGHQAPGGEDAAIKGNSAVVPYVTLFAREMRLKDSSGRCRFQEPNLAGFPAESAWFKPDFPHKTTL